MGNFGLRTGVLAFGLAGLMGGSFAHGYAVVADATSKAKVAVEKTTTASKPKIQIAILLDTSSSMSGLIGQAKTQLWNVVNEFINVKQGGVRPDLQVALYEYGKPTLGAESGYIRQITSFTTDLDKVSEELFALQTNGGDEYCGQVIQAAVKQLKWGSSSRDLKTIFIAGNEPFTLGKVNYADACRAAITKGITVNTIFCGARQQGINSKWQAGALLADGAYLAIDHNQKVVAINAPQDKEITKLGVALNDTYLPFGALGVKGAENQKAQDGNAKKSGASSSWNRGLSKASSYYQCDTWDLVDAVTNKKVKLEDVKEESLPKQLKGTSIEKQREIIKEKLTKRNSIKKKINTLNKERRAYVAAEQKKQIKKGGAESLDSAMVKALQKQALKQGYKFGE